MLTPYIPGAPTAQNLPVYLSQEQQKIAMSLVSIIATLQAVGVPIELGPPDSAGVGFRALRIPN